MITPIVSKSVSINTPTWINANRDIKAGADSKLPKGYETPPGYELEITLYASRAARRKNISSVFAFQTAYAVFISKMKNNVLKNIENLSTMSGIYSDRKNDLFP